MPGGIHPPIEVITSWPKPNFVDPERRGWGVVVLSIVLYAFALCIVSARLWARLFIQRKPGLDDACIVVAFLCATGVAIGTGLASKAFGFDRHVWDLPMSTLLETRKITMALECLYVASTSLTRISILLFYRRLANGTVSKVFIWLVLLCIAIVAFYFAIFEVTLFMGCHPFEAFWGQVDPSWSYNHEFNCIDEAGNLYAASIVSVVLDFIVCLMPTILFWKLQMPRQAKIALGGIFSVGLFLCICGILRIYYIRHVFYETYDVTWAAQDIWVWTCVEAVLAPACASAPALRIFFRRYFDPPHMASFRLDDSGSSSGPFSALVRFFKRSRRTEQIVAHHQPEEHELENSPPYANILPYANIPPPRIGLRHDATYLDNLDGSPVTRNHRDDIPFSSYGGSQLHLTQPETAAKVPANGMITPLIMNACGRLGCHHVMCAARRDARQAKGKLKAFKACLKNSPGFRNFGSRTPSEGLRTVPSVHRNQLPGIPERFLSLDDRQTRHEDSVRRQWLAAKREQSDTSLSHQSNEKKVKNSKQRTFMSSAGTSTTTSQFRKKGFPWLGTDSEDEATRTARSQASARTYDPTRSMSRFSD